MANQQLTARMSGVQLPLPPLPSWLALCAAILLCLSTAGRAQEPAPLRDKLKSEPFKIAWESYVDGHSQLFTMNADGSQASDLTPAAVGQEHYPQVSPDGSKVCFTIDTGEGRDAVRTLWVMDIDGKSRRMIADHAREPFWSPDSKVIGYLPQEYPKFAVIDYYTKGMMYYDLDKKTSEPHPNSANLRHLYHPRFAPNGKWIVSTVHGGMGFSHTILLIEAHGDRIINLKIPGCRPSISPDGKHVAWGSSDHDLDTAPLDTDSENPTVGPWQLRIHDERNKIYHIAWSPDGRYVAFSRGPDGEGDVTKIGTFTAACEIIGVYAKEWNLFAVSAEEPRALDLNKAGDADVVQLTTNGLSNKEPCWFVPAPAHKE